MVACACYYNVLIASSGDAQAERRQVFDAISEWNGRTSRKVLFVPLMWERHAISDADSDGPQDAISKQLLARSHFVIAIFKGRVGTPTTKCIGGTPAELAERAGRAAVFFCDSDLTVPRDATSAERKEIFEQLDKLEEFKKSIKGLSRSYSDPEDLAKKVRDQLDGWAEPADERPAALLAAYPPPWDLEMLAKHIENQSEDRCLLLYNPELNGFRDFGAFKQTWSFLFSEHNPAIRKVVFLLPEFKIARLRQYLPGIYGEIEKNYPGILECFSVCPVLEKASASPPRASSSLAFALVRRGSDPGEGDYLPVAHLVPLCEPFASARDYESGSPDIKWDYTYFIETEDRNLYLELQSIWRDYFNPAKTMPVLDFAAAATSAGDADLVLQQQRNAHGPNPHQNTTSLKLITQLRERLFDPNVPSYLLNEKYEMLDWNAAFELIFPTDRFYRNESVKEFVEVLDNKDEVKSRGAEIIRDTSGDAAGFLLEQLTFTSPVYGKMAFTKIASSVVFKESSGWIVALNINHVEHRGQYEEDLRRINREQTLISAYAEGIDCFQVGFPGLTALLRLHSRSLGNCSNILELGAGPGLLTQELLRGNKSVTAVESNDTMLGSLRTRCNGLSGLSILKANVESLHAPDPFYDNDKIGIHPPYDGVSIHNVYYWICDPANFLKRLIREELVTGGATVTLSLATPRSEIDEYFRALKQFRAESPKNGLATGFQDYLKAVHELLDLRIIGKYTENDVEQQFKCAGYEILTKEYGRYQVGSRTYQGFPFFVAKTPC